MRKWASVALHHQSLWGVSSPRRTEFCLAPPVPVMAQRGPHTVGEAAYSESNRRRLHFSAQRATLSTGGFVLVEAMVRPPSAFFSGLLLSWFEMGLGVLGYGLGAPLTYDP